MVIFVSMDLMLYVKKIFQNAFILFFFRFHLFSMNANFSHDFYLFEIA